MRYKPVLALAGGTVVLIAARTARRARCRRSGRGGVHAPSPPRLRLVTQALLLGWGFPDTSIDLSWVFFGLGQLIVGPLNWVLELVEKAVSGAIDDLADFTRVALDLGSQLVDNVIGTAVSLEHTVQGLADGAIQVGMQLTTLVPDAFRSALTDVEGLIDKAIKDWLPDVLRAVEAGGADLVRSVLGDLWDALEWLGDAFPVLRDGWSILVMLLTDPTGFVWGLIVQPLLSVAGDIVRAGLDLLWPGLSDLFDLLGTTLSWLLQFVTDPDTALDQLTQGLSSRLVPWIRDELVKSVDSNAPSLERWLTDALGLA